MASAKSAFWSLLKFLFRAKILVPLLLLLGLIGTSIYFQRKAAENKAGRYRTVAADRGGVVQRITANGTLNPVTVVSVGTQVSGTVTKLYTDFNNPVKANQVLLELDPALIKANLAQIDASVRSTEATARQKSPANADALIRLSEIRKSYFSAEVETPVLLGINVTIHKSEFVAMMGQSGSGKSTLMNIPGCLDTPTGGSGCSKVRQAAGAPERRASDV